MKQVRLIFVGGFLGAGKTTLIGQAARRLADQGKRVGLITNDQAVDLVDTGILKQRGLGLEEVAGGCFCCRFDDLVTATDRLINEIKPDVLLGEPVGRCTDISATVLQPMKKLYADWFRLAPFSVIADPARLRQALDSDGASGFPDSVTYIFRKQLEEADVIVINKVDLLSQEELAGLKQDIASRLPDTPVLVISALNGDGVDQWLDFVMQDRPAGQRIAEVDYDTYAQGEAVLGWLNGTVQLRAEGGAHWGKFTLRLLERLQEEFRRRSAEVAHVKLLVTTAGGSLVANLTSNDAEPVVNGEVGPGAKEALLVVNARVHMDPDELRATVEKMLGEAAGERIRADIVSIQSFSPARPKPTHRSESVV